MVQTGGPDQVKYGGVNFQNSSMMMMNRDSNSLFDVQKYSPRILRLR